MTDPYDINHLFSVDEANASLASITDRMVPGYGALGLRHASAPRVNVRGNAGRSKL